MLTFRAMNTAVTVTSSEDEVAVAERVLGIFEAAEQRFSRFREDSELSRLNRTRSPFRASPELFSILLRARSYVELTDGLFDPAVGSAMIALGYDRSFAPGALDRDASCERGERGSFLDVVLDAEHRVVTRPPHIHLDLGGMVKGATVDRAAVLLGPSGAIDAGGDAYLRGYATEDEEPWLVEVEDPRDSSQTLVTVAVANSAVATSAGNRRRWRRGRRGDGDRAGSQWVHHLIDPRTQRSAAEELLQATVFAPSTELADVLAKVAFVLGPREAPAFLERQAAVSAVLVPRCGRPLFVGNVDVREVAHA